MIPNTILGGYCIPSPLDKRDVLSSEIIPEIKRIPTAIPGAFDLEVLFQDGDPACVGFAGAGMKQYLEAKERINKIFDGLWIYDECKKIDNFDGPGTYLRIMLKVLKNIGAKPIGEPASEAWKYRIGGYARVDPLTFDEIRKATAVYGVVLLGFTGSNPGWQMANVRPPMAGEKTWGHGVFSDSYSQDLNDFQNSWKDAWGDKGIGHYNKNYLPFEAWIILNDRPNDLLPPVQGRGWVADEYLRASGHIIGQPVVTTARLNLRNSPSLSGQILSVLPNKQKLTIASEPVAKDGYNWVQVNEN